MSLELWSFRTCRAPDLGKDFRNNPCMHLLCFAEGLSESPDTKPPIRAKFAG